MDELIDKAIKTLLNQIASATAPDSALKITQSALNLAHVKQVLGQTKKD